MVFIFNAFYYLHNLSTIKTLVIELLNINQLDFIINFFGNCLQVIKPEQENQSRANQQYNFLYQIFSNQQIQNKPPTINRQSQQPINKFILTNPISQSNIDLSHPISGMSSPLKNTVSLEKTPRTSLSFLQDTEDSVEEFIANYELDPKLIKIIQPFTIQFKVYNGPQEHIKLVLHVTLLQRRDPKVVEMAKVNLYAVDLKSQNLVFRSLYETEQDNQLSFRDIVVHSNLKELFVVFNTHIQKYYFVKQPSIQRIPYSLNLVKTHRLPPNLLLSSITPHPSTSYLLAINISNPPPISTNSSINTSIPRSNSTQPANNTQPVTRLTPVKLDLESFKVQAASMQVQDTCIDYKNFKGNARWNIAIHPAEQYAIIAGEVEEDNYVCKWDIAKMEIKLQLFKTPDPTLPIPILQYSQYLMKLQLNLTSQPIDRFFSISSVGVLNTHRSPFLIAYESKPRCGHIFRLMPDNSSSNGQSLQYTDMLDYLDEKRAQIFAVRRVKCIDVVVVDAYACVTVSGNYVIMAKLDSDMKFVITMEMQGKNSKKINANPTLSTLDVFYNEVGSELCTIMENMVQCYQMKTACKGSKTNNANQTLVLVNQCPEICQKDGMFWNPAILECEECPPEGCQCKKSYMSFNPFRKNCTLDCSKIKYAIPGSKYGSYQKNTERCVCQPAYTWYHQQHQCRVNCSTIKNAKPDPKSNQNLNLCQCRDRYQYINQSEYYNIAGQCRLICKKGKKVLYRNTTTTTNTGAKITQLQQYCECDINEKWNWERFYCVGVRSQNFGLPGWAIAVIVLGIVLVLALVGVIIAKKFYNKNGQYDDDQILSQAPSPKKVRSRRQRLSKSQKSRQSTHSQPKSARNLNPRACTMCNSRDPKTNCTGPCGHYFHFECIKDKLYEGILMCPQCRTEIVSITQISMARQEEDQDAIQVN